MQFLSQFLSATTDKSCEHYASQHGRTDTFPPTLQLQIKGTFLISPACTLPTIINHFTFDQKHLHCFKAAVCTAESKAVRQPTGRVITFLTGSALTSQITTTWSAVVNMCITTRNYYSHHNKNESVFSLPLSLQRAKGTKDFCSYLLSLTNKCFQLIA